jgi:hypothetical protein
MSTHDLSILLLIVSLSFYLPAIFIIMRCIPPQDADSSLKSVLLFAVTFLVGLLVVAATTAFWLDTITGGY